MHGHMNVKQNEEFDICFFRASLYKRREENQLDATEWFIALINCSTCFGHLYAHRAASLIPDA